MKTCKKMLAMLMAVVMVLAMGIMASAAEEPSHDKATLIVRANEGSTSLAGQTLKLYRLFDVSVETNGSYKYRINDAFKDAVIAAVNVVDSTTITEGEEAYSALSGYGNDSEKLKKFIAEFIKTNTANATEEKDFLTSDPEPMEYKFTNLEYGYYLVQPSDPNLQSSLTLLTLATPAETAILKGELPAIDKKAYDLDDKPATSVEIGDVIRYEITGKFPAPKEDEENYKFIINDTLTNGLDFVNIENEIVGNGTKKEIPVTVTVKDVKDSDSNDANKTNYSEALNFAVDSTNLRMVKMDLSKFVEYYPGKEFTVSYYAKVNKDAVVETHNSATLKYGNGPEGDGSGLKDTPEVKAETPTYPIKIHKSGVEGIDENAVLTDMLAGAQFKLYADPDLKTEIPLAGQDGKYYVAKEEGTPVGYAESIGNAIATATGYNLYINGLKAGTYWLKEIKAPEEYNKLESTIKITIEESPDEDVNHYVVYQDDRYEGDQIIDVVNNKGTMLPSTGGIGSIFFTIAAVLAVLGVAISYVKSRKRA